MSRRLVRGRRERRRTGLSATIVPAIMAALLIGLPTGRHDERGTGSEVPMAIAASDSADAAPADHLPTIAILCYHDIRVDPSDATAIAPDTLRAHIRLAKANGWTFVRLADVIAARAHPESLPARSLVLTFDDGYRSFLTRALPILREEGVPATIAIVSDFVDHAPRDLPPIMSWRDIWGLDKADDVEVVSHSHALHVWSTCDPQGDSAPSVSTRRYLTRESRYENRDEYTERIRRDMAWSRRIMRSQLRHDVDVYIWPYGETNERAQELAAEAGFKVTLALGDRLVSRADLAAGLLPRFMVRRGQPIPAVDPRWLQPARRPVLAAQADLDAVWDEDGEVFERNVARMIGQARRIGATHVFLQACPDPNGDGFFRETWFMNHQAPIKADVWASVATRIRRAGFKVWLRAPSLNLSWAWQKHAGWRIPFRGSRRGVTPWYFRVSPDLPDARTAALDFYGDLAVYLPIDGILFDDDAYMLPGERLHSGEKSPAAKAEAIREHLEAIKQVVRAWRPQCQFGRSLYAPVVEKSGVSAMFAQDLDATLRDEDLVVVMAYARMEDHANDAERWVGSLAKTATRRWQDEARRQPGGGQWADQPPIMFKLQAYDWQDEAWVPSDELVAQARAVRAAGITQLGLYPVLPDEGELPVDLLRAPGASAGAVRQQAAETP